MPSVHSTLSLPRTVVCYAPEIPGYGQRGLFVTRCVGKGETVAAMDMSRVRVISEKERDRELEQCPKRPQDFVIWAGHHRGGFVTDWPKGNHNDRPLWYFMNHNDDDPNCALRWCGTQKCGHMRWEATRDIATGEQLMFDYGDVLCRNWKA